MSGVLLSGVQTNSPRRNWKESMSDNEPIVLKFAVFNAALARAQSRIRTIGRDRDVEVKSDKGRYAFRYATLSAIHDAVREALTSEGFAWLQFPSVNLKEGTVAVRTELCHASGESREGTVELPLVDKAPQKIGGVISYARRYGLSAMLGVASADEVDFDDEGGRFSGMEAPPRPTQSPPAAPVVAPAASVTPAVAAQKVSAVFLGMRLNDATTKAELDAVGPEIKAARAAGQITEAQREDLLGLYRAMEVKLGKETK